MKKYKERAVRYFVVFMLFMLVCTIVSRGIYAYRMPKVTLGTMETHTLKRKISASGSVMTKEEVPITVGAGLLIEKVCVVAGEKVEPGDVLFQIEPADLEKLISQADQQIQAEEAKLAELNASGNAAVNRAGQDLKDAEGSGANDVGRANEAYQAAVALRDGAPSLEAYKQKAYKQDADYQKLYKESKKKKAKKEDKEAFNYYKKSLDARLEESYAQEKKALDDAVSEKADALNEANKSSSDSVKQARRALEDAKSSGSGTRLEQENALQQLKENRKGLQALKASEGKVVCPVPGYVSRILVQAGERTGDASAMVLSDAGGERLFCAVLPQEEKNYVVPGDKMEITFPNGGKSLYGVKVMAVGSLEDGSCQVTGKIEDKDVEIGQTGNMEMEKDIGRYGCTIPLSALYSRDNADYVMIVEEEATILGTELTARKRKVKVLDKDEEYAALEDGALTDEEKIITEADKDIKDGASVRRNDD